MQTTVYMFEGIEYPNEFSVRNAIIKKKSLYLPKKVNWNRYGVTVKVKEYQYPEVKANYTLEISRLKRQLLETDYVVIKIAEDAASPIEYADVLKQRKAWRKEINRLEDLLKSLENV